MTEISRDPMRRALRALTHGVYVLSVGVENNGRTIDDYLIVSLVMQCGVEPPRVAIALSVNARILQPMRTAGGGVLNVLDTTQVAAVRRYGMPGGVRRPPVDVVRAGSHPLVPEMSFWLHLKLEQELPSGDHCLFLCAVVAAGASASVNAAILPVTNVSNTAGSETDLVAPMANDDSVLERTSGDTRRVMDGQAVFNALILAKSGFPYAG